MALANLIKYYLRANAFKLKNRHVILHYFCRDWFYVRYWNVLCFQRILSDSMKNIDFRSDHTMDKNIHSNYVKFLQSVNQNPSSRKNSKTNQNELDLPIKVNETTKVHLYVGELQSSLSLTRKEDESKSKVSLLFGIPKVQLTVHSLRTPEEIMVVTSPPNNPFNEIEKINTRFNIIEEERKQDRKRFQLLKQKLDAIEEEVNTIKQALSTRQYASSIENRVMQYIFPNCRSKPYYIGSFKNLLVFISNPSDKDIVGEKAEDAWNALTRDK